MGAIALPAPGLVGGPFNWKLEELGRIIARVRPAGGADSWYLLAPQAPNTITVAGRTITVTVSLVVTAGAEIGGTISITGGNASDLEVTVFLNVGASQPSFVLFGTMGVGAQLLPDRVAATVTVPASGLPNVTNLTLGLDATGVTAPLAIRGGRINVPAATAQAKVAFTATGLVTAVTELGPRGSTLVSTAATLLGVAISPLGVPLGPLPTQVQVPIPSREADAAALTDPTVTTLTHLTAAISRGAMTRFDLAPIAVNIGFAAPPTPADPAVDTFHYHAPVNLDVVLGALIKTPTARDNLKLTTLDALLSATGLPTDLTVTTAEMPPITGPTFPDPALAKPVLEYVANGRLSAISGALRTHGEAANPLQKSPATDACIRFDVADLPRGLRLRSGQFNPNFPEDTYLELAFTDGAGGPDGPVTISGAVRPNAVMPTLTPVTPQFVRFDATDSLAVVSFKQLIRGELRLETRKAGSPLHDQMKLHAAYESKVRAPAHAELVLSADKKATLDVDELPKKFTLDLQLPELTPAFDSKTDWMASAAWSADAATNLVGGTFADKAGPSYAAFQVQTLPTVIAVSAANVTGVTTVTLNSGNDQTGKVDARLSSAAITSPLPVAPFGLPDLDVHVSSLPAWARASIDRSTPDAFPFRYRASHPIAWVTLGTRDGTLVAAPTGADVGKPSYDHLELRLTAIPGTPGSGAPDSAANTFPIYGTIDKSFKPADPSYDPPPIIRAAVPGGGPALGAVEVELTDKPGRMPAGAPAEVSVGIVNRFAYPPTPDNRLPADAPTGRRVRVSLPGLRSVEFNQRNVTVASEPEAKISLGAPRPTWIRAWFDADVPVRLEFASDERDTSTNLIGSTWAKVKLDALRTFVVDGNMKTSDGGIIAAVETFPRGQTLTGTVLAFDGAPRPFFDGSTVLQADAIEARKSRAEVRTVLPDRLEAKVDCASLLANFFVTAVRKGTQLSAHSPEILAGQPSPEIALAAWLMLHNGFDDRMAIFTPWCADATTRVELRIDETKEFHRDDLAKPDPQEGQRSRMAPPYAYFSELVQATALVRVSGIRIVEVSKALSSTVTGQQPARYLAAMLQPLGGFPIDILHLENGVDLDHIQIRVKNIGEAFSIMWAPETEVPVSGQVAAEYRIDMPGIHPISIDGGWRFGFPRIRALDKTHRHAVMRSDGTGDPRPLGLTNIDVKLNLTRFLAFSRVRNWGFRAKAGIPSAFSPDDPLVTEVWRSDDDFHLQTGGLDASGRVVNSRPPSDGLLALIDTPQTPHTIRAVQSPLRTVDYSLPETPQLDNPLRARPGQSASPHSLSFNIQGLLDLKVESSGLVDQNGRGIPTFWSDDNKTIQQGNSKLHLELRTRDGQTVPLNFGIAEFEDVDWQDAPSGPPRDAVIAHLDTLPTFVKLQKSGTVSRTNPGTKPTEEQRLVLQSFPVGTSGGPPFGIGNISLATLDTSSNIWVPAITTLDATLTAIPSFVSLQIDANVPIDHFPIHAGTTGLDPTKLDVNVAGWNTSRVLGICSGPLSGNITAVNFGVRGIPSTRPAPFAAPGGIKWSRTKLENFTAAPSVGTPSLLFPHFAILSASSGPQNRDDEKSAVALYALCNDFTLDGLVTSEKQVGLSYPAVPGMPFGSRVATFTGGFIDPVVVKLMGFSGRLSVQERDTKLLGALKLAVLPLLGPTGLNPWTLLIKLLIAKKLIDDVFDDNSPIRVDSLCKGDWYITPADHSLGALGAIIAGLGHNKGPGSFDLKKQGLALVWAIAALFAV